MHITQHLRIARRHSGQPGPGKVLRRLIVGTGAAAAALAGILSIANAAPASAAAEYSINMTQACNYTYNNPTLLGIFLNPASPYSWVCMATSVGLPVGISGSIVGGVNVQKYCSITHPGSRAVIVADNAFGWRCES